MAILYSWITCCFTRVPARSGLGSRQSHFMNAAWHRTHRMPKNATVAQRVRWHLAHLKACDCRAMPASIQGARCRPWRQCRPKRRCTGRTRFARAP
jgi:hypothetical protein